MDEQVTQPKPSKRWKKIALIFIFIVVLYCIGLISAFRASAQDIPLYQQALGINETDKYTYDIISLYEKDNVKEILVKVYDKFDAQYSFGKNGITEIERIVIYNMPRLIPTLQRENKIFYNADIEYYKSIPVYKDDQKQALLTILDKIMQNKIYIFKDKNIEYGTIGNSTYVYYPDANPETSSFDGNTYRYASDTFSNVRNNNGATQGTLDNYGSFYVSAFIRSDSKPQFSRGIIGFDTSNLDDEEIDSATLNLTPYQLIDTNGDDLVVTSAGPANNDGLVDADYVNAYTIDSPTEYSSRVSIDDMLEDEEESFPISPTSIINYDDTTFFGLRSSFDVDNEQPTGGSTADAFGFYQMENTTDAPNLMLEVSSSTPPVGTTTSVFTATSTVDQIQDNFFYAFLMFFISSFFVLYLLTVNQYKN